PPIRSLLQRCLCAANQPISEPTTLRKRTGPSPPGFPQQPRRVWSLEHSPPGLRQSLTSSRGWRLRGEADPFEPAPPSIRVNHINDRSHYTAFVHRRLEARTGGASPSHPRLPHGTPGGFSVTPSSPVHS